MRCMAGEAIRSLPVGVAYISYVGKQGRVATRLQVPEIRTGPMPEAQFVKIAQCMIAASPSGLLVAEAEQQIEAQQQRLAGLAAVAEEQHEDPESFRVAAPAKTTATGKRRSLGKP